MTTVEREAVAPTPQPGDGDARRPGDLGPRELARWGWRQLTSMRTALVLLLLLALAAVPGSVVPQEGVDSLAASRWKIDHPTLSPIYERLGLFSVYDTPWFAAIYLLLVVSLVGCILPRTLVYARALRAVPPAAPRNLARLPVHRSFVVEAEPAAVLDDARRSLRRSRHRLRPAAATGEPGRDAVSGERGYLREAGNLLFHVSVLVVMAGFGLGSAFGYQGGVIVLQGDTFANSAVAYDDFDPGTRFSADGFDPFTFTVEDFDIEWLTSGPGYGTARSFVADLAYAETVGGGQERYDLRVNHPLSIGDTDVFLIGHGYAPEITVTDGEGNVAYSGPTVFLPQDLTFLSYGVVKAPAAEPGQIGLDGVLYPTFGLVDGDPTTIFPALGNPLISMNVYSGDLGFDDGTPQSVYTLDTERATPVPGEGGRPLRIDLKLGDTVPLPDGLGTVSFDGITPWVRVQISQTPGKLIALTGVVLALIGLLGSLFVRSRRVWVRAAPARDRAGATLVEVAMLDRSGGADLTDVLDRLVADLGGPPSDRPLDRPIDPTKENA